MAASINIKNSFIFNEYFTSRDSQKARNDDKSLENIYGDSKASGAIHPLIKIIDLLTQDLQYS